MGWDGNSFAKVFVTLDSLIRPVAPYKLGISQAAMMRGEGVV